MKSFAIKFKNGNYFVTSADDPQTTFADFIEKGYEPLAIESIIDNAESYHEWALFRDYLNLYGIERVRGASYTEWILTVKQRETLMTFVNSWTPGNDTIIEKLVGSFENVGLIE